MRERHRHRDRESERERETETETETEDIKSIRAGAHTPTGGFIECVYTHSTHTHTGV